MKYTKSKLVKKKKTMVKGRNTKKATIISRRKGITIKGITLKGNTQRGITQKGNTQKASRKEATRQKA